MPLGARTPSTQTLQQTLKAPIGCVGVGLHSGRRVSLSMHPAPAGHGIVFRRTDLGCDIPAQFDHVADARLSTVLAHPDDPTARIGTIEHVMAALAGTGIDNVLVALDGPELPILDGFASPYVFLIDCAGIVEQGAPRPVIEVLRPVRVSEGDASVELRPAGTGGFEMALTIDFSAAAIGRQSVALRLTPEIELTDRELPRFPRRGVRGPAHRAGQAAGHQVRRGTAHHP